MSGPVAVTATARYRGLDHGNGASFLGLRYAEPPFGPLRFRAPVRHEAVGEIDATQAGPAPAQVQRPMPDWAPRQTGFETGEDCLNLNVFTPAADENRRPVIVHAFGGGFQTGSASGTYHDDIGFAVRGDVVLVRPNMRVGALGFLHLGPATGEQDLPANRGMLDFIAALEWVRDNIAAFGGDPDNVTLIGMSSGAFTIGALLGTDMDTRLFRRAWMMSGSASRIVDAQTADGMARDFFAQAAIDPTDRSALEAMPLDIILDIQEKIVATHLGERNAPGGKTLGIVADDTSLARHPLDGLSGGRWRDHEMVLEWSEDEARMWYAFGIMPEVETEADLRTSIARFGPDDARERLTRLRSEYPDASLTVLEEIFLSRAVYRDPALRTAKAHAAVGGTAFTCAFAWKPEPPMANLGSAHGFDEPFVFGNVEPSRIPLTTGSQGAAGLAHEMSLALYRFAETGDPGWDPVSADLSVGRIWR